MAPTMATLQALSPYVVMVIVQLSLAGLFIILQSALDPSAGLSSIVIVVYQQLLSSLLLLPLAVFLDRGKRPKLTFEILCFSFIIGILQTPIGSMMLTASLKYITPTFQSVAINTIPVWVFILAVILGRESFRFWGIYHQAKFWGITVSVAGAIVMLTLTAPASTGVAENGGQLVGVLMAGASVVAEAVATVMLEIVALKYPADLSLAAIITVFGTLQAAVVGVFIERDSSSWMIRWNRSLELVAIVYAGLYVNGLLFFARTWCIHREGPVFVTAFSPLLVVFSFILQAIFGTVSEIGSMFAAVPVIGGLYLLLWAKSRDRKAAKLDNIGQTDHLADTPSTEALLPK